MPPPGSLKVLQKGKQQGTQASAHSAAPSTHVHTNATYHHAIRWPRSWHQDDKLLRAREYESSRGHQGQAVASVDMSSAAGDTEVAEEVKGFILSGALLEECGLTPELVEQDISTWLELGGVVSRSLGFPEWQHMNSIQRLRVYQYYLPIYFWCQRQLQEHRSSRTDGRPLVIGMNAPQGCGKTTITEELVHLFEHCGERCVSISVDDFYLTFQDQQALAAANPSNSIVQVRGNAGTHDLQLGTETLQTLTGLTSPGQTARLPRYDKSQNSGRGDRADPATWPVVEGPVSVVLFEGWMLGHPPVTDEAAAAVSPDLVPVNETLRKYKEAWDSFVDAWLVVKVATPDWVYRWRWQAEEQLWKKGKKGMSEQQVMDFVDRYMPAYRAYLPPLYEKGPTTAQPGKLLVIEIDDTRAPVSQQPAPIM